MYTSSPGQSFNTQRSHSMSMSGNASRRLQNYRPLLCRFHPNKELHSFCLSRECLLPMCSACITVHNQDHLEAKTHGDYQDIAHLLKSAVQAIQDQQLCLEDLSREYVTDFEDKTTRESTCKAIVSKARSKAHQELDRVFDKFLIALEDKLSAFTQILQTRYQALQESIHSTYRLLTQQKEDLSKVFVQSSFTGDFSVNLSQTISSGQPFTSSTGFNSSKQRELTLQEQKKVLKALIEHFGNSFNQENDHKIKIKRIQKQISELKLLNFHVQFSFQKIRQLLSAICSEAIDVKQGSGSKTEIKRQEKDVRFVNSQVRKQQTYNSSYEINEIMKQTHERLKKMQLAPKSDGLA